MIAALGAALIAVSCAGLFLFARLHRLTRRHGHDFYAVAVDYNGPALRGLSGAPGATGILFRCALCHEVKAVQIEGCWTLADVRAGDQWTGDKRYTEVAPAPDEADEFIGEMHDATHDGDTDWTTRAYSTGPQPAILPRPVQDVALPPPPRRPEDEDTSANLPAVPGG